MEEEYIALNQLIEKELKSNPTLHDSLYVLFQKQIIISNQITEYRKYVEKIYEIELLQLMKERDSGTLNTEETEVLDKEIQILFTFWSFNLDDPELDLTQLDLKSKLSGLPEKIKSQCPLICNILETLLKKQMVVCIKVCVSEVQHMV